MYKPQDEAELSEIIAAARAPLCVQGGGTRGCAVEGDLLSTRGLSGVELYEPGSLTLVAKAGTPLAEIETLLAREGQRMAFEPMDMRGLLGRQGCPTIGGAFASNSTGPRRIQGGAARDYLLGVRFVDGGGQVVKNGGRVMKNVTGYDLVKLMAGAHSTLGVLSEVSLKVLPVPEASATLCISVAELETAVRTMSVALGSPFDVTGAAYDPQARQVYIRLEGFAPSVAYRQEKLTRDLARFGDVEVRHETEALWRDIGNVAGFAGQAGDVWRISVKPSDASVLVPMLGAKGVKLDWGGGLIWALMPEGLDLRARLLQAGVAGHATLIRGSADTFARLGRFQPQVAPLERISQALRHKFDPRGLLNAGLMETAPVTPGRMG